MLTEAGFEGPLHGWTGYHTSSCTEGGTHRGKGASVSEPCTLFSTFPRGKSVPGQQPLPPARPSQVRVAGRYRVLLPLPGADDERVVELNGHHPPELLDRVGVGVAVGCGL